MPVERVQVSMVSPADIKNAKSLINRGFFAQAKSFFSDLLTNTTDPVMERIAENNLNDISKRMKIAMRCCQFDIESESEQNGFVLCLLRIVYKEVHVKKLLEDLFANSHKKIYKPTSSISFFHSASQQTTIELYGMGYDPRCEVCTLFRKSFIHYMGKGNIVRNGHCPLGHDV